MMYRTRMYIKVFNTEYEKDMSQLFEDLDLSIDDFELKRKGDFISFVIDDFLCISTKMVCNIASELGLEYEAHVCSIGLNDYIFISSDDEKIENELDASFFDSPISDDFEYSDDSEEDIESGEVEFETIVDVAIKHRILSSKESYIAAFIINVDSFDEFKALMKKLNKEYQIDNTDENDDQIVLDYHFLTTII